MLPYKEYQNIIHYSVLFNYNARPMGLGPTVYPVTGDRFSQLNYGRMQNTAYHTC